MALLEVQLKGILGNDAVLSLSANSTVQELKHRLAADKGLSTPDLCLIFKGTFLSDSMRLDHIPWSSHHPIHWVKFRRTQQLPDFQAVPLAAPLVPVVPAEEAIVPAMPADAAVSFMQMGLQMYGFSPEQSTSLAAVQAQAYANPALNAAMTQFMDQPAYAQMVGAYMQSNPNLQAFAGLYQNPETSKMCMDLAKACMQSLVQPGSAGDYQEQMQQLQMQGYGDVHENQAALKAAEGDIQMAIQMLSKDSNS